MSQKDISDAGSAGAAPDRRRLLQDALGAIERLQARVHELESARHEPIAIVGMACRLPGGVRRPEQLWQLLVEERDAVTEVPPDRWDVPAFFDPDPEAQGKSYTFAGGFVDGLELFDPGFFGISPREAVSLDPQQRLLLEGTWQALESAGIRPDTLDGSRSGVFVGVTSTDYAQRIDIDDPTRSDMYVATGAALNAAAGRISFALGLRGPCMAVDTACSSSLVALHAACQSLRGGESELAIVGGVNLILDPKPFVLLSKFKMLAPDGRCKAFDATANGFVRGEGCSVIVLKRLSDAQAAGDTVLAVIRGSAINQDGRSSGLTVPNGIAQQEVVRAALASAQLRPADVSYVEAHGTGTSLGDPIEVEALGQSYGEGRAPGDVLEIGSLKSNLGHLEAASGLTGVIKVVLALQHRRLPASLHFRDPSPAIDWDRLPVRVSTGMHDWRPAGGVCRAGVSAFGFSGMNAHIVLEQAPPAPAVRAAAPDRGHALLVLSARSNAALSALAGRYADHLQLRPDQALADVCHSAAIGRAAMPQRLALLAADRQTMVAQLRAAAQGEPAGWRGQATASGRHRIAFVFTGQGAQYAGMGRELYTSEPVFRQVIDRCAAVLDAGLPKPLARLLFEDDGDGLLDQTGCTQPALYALEVALAALWRHWGVEPTVVLGHSVGEFAAAATAGVFSIEDGARLIAERGRLMQALPAGGTMLAVQAEGVADVARVEQAVALLADRVSVAAWNGPTSVVIAGAADVVQRLAEQLSQEGMRTQPLTVSHAFHSPLMVPMLAEFERFAAGIACQAPTLDWISTLDGSTFDAARWGTRMARYWSEHVRQPVRFAAAMQRLVAQGCDRVVEIGPHPVLTGMAREFIDSGTSITWAASLHRKRPGDAQMLESAGRLFVEGVPVDWTAVDAAHGRLRVALPTYPFQRQRYWMAPLDAKRPVPRGALVHPLLGERLSTPGVAARFERRLTADDPAWLRDHRVGAEVVMPMTGYLEAAQAALRTLHGHTSWELLDVDLAEPLVLPEGEARLMQVVVEVPADTGGQRITVYSRSADGEDEPWQQHARMLAGPVSQGAPTLPSLVQAEAAVPGDVQWAAAEPFYAGLRELGIDFGPAFCGMQRVRTLEPGSALAELTLPTTLQAEVADYLIHPALLDTCLHAGPQAIRSVPGIDPNAVYLPVGLQRLQRLGEPVGTLRCLARVRMPVAHGEVIELDLRVERPDGQPVLLLDGLRCQRTSRDVFRQRQRRLAAAALHDIAWTEQPLPAGQPRAAGAWLLFDDGRGVAAALAAGLRERGAEVATVQPGGARGRDGAQLVIDPTRVEDYDWALQQAADGRPLAGVALAWPLRLPTLGPRELPSAIQALGTDAALFLVQALARLATAPRLWVVTRGSQRVDGTENLRLEQAGSAALVRVVAAEHPELRASSIDLDPQGRASESNVLLDELAGDGDENQVALRKGVRRVARLRSHVGQVLPAALAGPHQLVIERRGTLENLALEPLERRAPQSGEVELRVRASGVNFRDVLIALDLYPGAVPRLGSDCAGDVVAVGPGVTQWKVGDRVVAMVEGAFASHAIARAEFVAPLPPGIDYEQGAAAPSAWLTADITLHQIAGLKRGDKVLIHAGAGGVGMAAVLLARRAGAEIFATAGSAEKRQVLQAMGVQHVLDSRSTAFADEVLRLTGGRGVDIVLNSLAGDIMARSYDVLARGGTFLEIGKRGVWSAGQVAALGRDLRYHVVDCSEQARATPAVVRDTLSRLLDDMAAGRLDPLPLTTFALERASEAFRHMAQARHIGRVVLRHPPDAPDTRIQAEGTYVVTGGLRGLGWLAAQWLAEQGARHLLLAGRGAPDAAVAQAIDGLRARGVQVEVVAADVGTDEGVQRLVAPLGTRLPAPAGLLHCAGVLDDGLLSQQTLQRFAAVAAPKSDAAWRLHVAFAERGFSPALFVLYSSMASVFGSPAQGNYVAANGLLDALAAWRQGRGLPGLSLNWGPWKDVGMATRGQTLARASQQGLDALGAADGMAAFALAIGERVPQMAVASIHWDRLAEQFGSESVPPLLRDLIEGHRVRRAAAPAHGRDTQTPEVLAQLAPAERRGRVAAIVRREAARVLALPDGGASIEDTLPLSTLGLDSLTAMELRNRLQVALGLALPAAAALMWPTVAELTEQVDRIVVPDRSGDGSASREEVTL